MRSIGTLAVLLDGKTAAFQRQFAGAEKTLVRFGNRAQTVGKQMTTLGRTMSMSLTLPLVALAGMGVKAFAGFDKAMIESLAIMGDVSEAMKKDLADEAKRMSTKSTFAAKALAKGYFFLTSAGMDAVQSLKALAPATMFAQAGAFDLALAVDLLTDAQSALGLTSKDAETNMKNMTKVSDVLVKANTIANATTQQFSESLTRQAGPAMKEMKMDIEEGVSVLAAFADQGIKAELAGGYLARTLRLLGQGAVKHKAAYKRLGIEVFDGQGKMKKMADIIESLTKALGPMSDELRIATFGEIGFAARTRMAIAPLMGLSNKIREYEKQLRSAGGVTEEVARKQLEAFSNQLKILWNRVVLAGMEIGKVMVPAIKKLSSVVEKALGWFMKLTDKQKKLIVIFGAILAAIGPVLLIVGQLAIGIGALAIVLPALIASLVALPGMFAGMVAGIIAALPLVLSIVAAIAGIGAVFVSVIGEGETFKERFADTMKKIKGWAMDAGKAIMKWLMKWGPVLIDTLQIMWIEIQYFFKKLTKVVDIAFENLFTAMFGFTDDWKVIFNWLSDNWKSIWNNISSWTTTVLKNIGANAKAILGAVWKWLKAPWEKFEMPEMKGITEGFKKIQIGAPDFDKSKRKYRDFIEEVSKLDDERLGKINKALAEGAGQKLVEMLKKSVEEFKKAPGVEDKKPAEGLVTSPAKYAAAVEKGTVEAYRAELGQQKILTKVEKNTKEQVDQGRKMLRGQDTLIKVFGDVTGEVVEI